VARLIDNTARILEQLVRDTDKRLRAAALLLQAEHKRDLSTANPAPHRNPSRPGQYPKARTYNLRDAVTAEMVKYGVEWRVGYLVNAEYILALTNKQRKNIEDTAERIRPRINQLLQGK
jgi:hypothetical protein